MKIPIWWGWLDLNQRPISYEPTALTTELHPRAGYAFAHYTQQREIITDWAEMWRALT